MTLFAGDPTKAEARRKKLAKVWKAIDYIARANGKHNRLFKRLDPDLVHANDLLTEFAREVDLT